MLIRYNMYVTENSVFSGLPTITGIKAIQLKQNVVTNQY